MSALQRGKTEENNGLRALIDELYARKGGGGSPGTKTPLYSVVLRPGDTSGAVNVFKTWAALYAACVLIQGGVRVTFDDSLGAIDIPAGTYAIDGWQWVSGTGSGATVSILDGAHATWGNLWIDAVLVNFAGATAFQDTTTAASLYLTDGASLTCTSTGPFLTATGAGFAFVTTGSAVSIGDGTHVAISASAGGTLEMFAVEGSLAAAAVSGTGSTRATINFNAGTFLSLSTYPSVTPIPGTTVVDVKNHCGAIGDGIADDTAAIQYAVTTFAGTGIDVFFGAGIFLVSTPILFPVNAPLHVRGTRGVSVLKSTITPSGGPGGSTQTVFYSAAQIIGVASTLAATPTLRSRSLSSNASFAEGTIVIVQTTGNVGQQFTIAAPPSGGGPFTLTTDDPVLSSFVSGNTIAAYNVPTGIWIEGLTFSGTGDRAIELGAALNCLVTDCEAVPTYGAFTSIVMSFDIAGRRNTHDTIDINQGGGANGGVALESNSFSTQRDIKVNAVAGSGSAVGIFWPTPMACEGFNLTAIACPIGMQVSQSDNTDTVGPIDGSIVGLTVLDSTTSSGIVHESGQNFSYANVKTDGNANDGMTILPSSSTPADGITITNYGAAVNAGIGLNVNGSACRVFASNVTTQGNGGGGLSAAGNGYVVEVDGFQSTDDVGGPWQSPSGTGVTLSIRRARVRNVSLNGFWTPDPACTGSISLDDYVAEYVSGTGVKAVIDCSGAFTLYMRNVKTIGALTFGVFAGNGVAVVVRDQGGNNLESCGTPFTYDGTSRPSRGSLVAAGSGSAQSVAFPDLTSNDRVYLQRTVAGGTPGTGQPLVIPTVGVGWTETFAATDTSTYEHAVE